MTFRRYFVFIFAFIILFIGGIIYICFRDENILLFSGLRYLNFNYSLFRQINIEKNILSGFIIYNLPNGLWALSGLLFLQSFLTDKKMLKLYSTIYIGICLLYEIGQFFNFVPGTFDIFDIISIIIFSGIGLSINFLWRKHEKA